MANYFLDSSAIVKRYAVETSSDRILEILRPSTGNLVFVARIAGAEVVAALARKRKGKIVSPAEAEKAIRRFRRHFSRRYQKVTITDNLVAAAMDFADKYELRGYDAIQLAAAAGIENELKDAGSPPLIFVSFDADLNLAAISEGLSVEGAIGSV